MIKFSLPDKVRGILCVVSGFMIQMVVGSYVSAFGNFLPYLVSYKRQFDDTITYGDMAILLPAGGILNGISSLISGSIIIPLVGARLCLLIGCLICIVAPLLGNLALDSSQHLLAFSYGVLPVACLNIVAIPTMMFAVSWFPESRGKVVGAVMAGMGLSSLVFVPLGTYLTNPGNIQPVKVNGTGFAFFDSPDVLDRVPDSLLWLSLVYALLLGPCLLFCTEKTNQEENVEKTSKIKDIRESFNFLIKVGLRSRDFYLLFIIRSLLIAIGVCIFSQWKSFSLLLSSDDRLLSIIGGVGGIFNSLSRFAIAALLDKYKFGVVMSIQYLLLAANMASIYWVGFNSFPGFCALILLAYFLTFSFFSAIPAQILKLYPGKHSGAIIGAVGLADSLGFIGLLVINKLLFTGLISNHFIIFFILLVIFAIIAAFLSLFVREPQNEDMKTKNPRDSNIFSKTKTWNVNHGLEMD